MASEAMLNSARDSVGGCKTDTTKTETETEIATETGRDSETKDEKPSGGLVVQRYLTRPLLINGLKFDMRVYVLVTSVHPLRVHVYNDGIVKFCSSEFSLDTKTLGEAFRHLANYALNKHNNAFDESNETNKGRFRHDASCP